MPRSADPGGPPFAAAVTCSRSWLSGAQPGKTGGGEIEETVMAEETQGERGLQICGEREETKMEVESVQ